MTHLYLGALTAAHIEYAFTIEPGISIDIAYLPPDGEDDVDGPYLDLIRVGAHWLNAIEVIHASLLSAWHDELRGQLAADAVEESKWWAKA